MNLSTGERIELNQLEACMRRGFEAFYEAGQALKSIRDKRLYREDYETFEDYCLDRWRMSRPRAYQLMESSQVVQNLSLSTNRRQEPASEWQVRPLTRLEPEEQAEAWEAAQTIATGHKPTANHVARAAEAVKSKSQEFEPGKRVTVLDESSPHYGKEVEVLRTEGVIVEAKTTDGSTQPFLRNELISDKTVPRAAQPAKVDRLEATLTELEVANLRIEALEEMLTRLIQEARSGQVGEDLLDEAEGML